MLAQDETGRSKASTAANSGLEWALPSSSEGAGRREVINPALEAAYDGTLAVGERGAAVT